MNLRTRRRTERGYAVARDANGRTLASVADFAPGREFTLRLRDGELDAEARVVRNAAGGAS